MLSRRRQYTRLHICSNGFPSIDPRRVKKQGGGRGNWGRVGDEVLAMTDKYVDEVMEDRWDQGVFYIEDDNSGTDTASDISGDMSSDADSLCDGQGSPASLKGKEKEVVRYFLARAEDLDLDR